MADILVVADEPWVLNDAKRLSAKPATRLPRSPIPGPSPTPLHRVGPMGCLVDLQVGSMGGMAITRAVRDAFTGTDRTAPPVILLLDRDADAFLAGRSGAAAWVRKPFFPRATWAQGHRRRRPLRR